jgi:signal transduction histidine kinase
MTTAGRRGATVLRAGGRLVVRLPVDVAFLLLGGLTGTVVLNLVNWTIWTTGPWFAPLILFIPAWLLMPAERLRLRLVGLRVPAPDRVRGRGALLRVLVRDLTPRHVGYLAVLGTLGSLSCLATGAVWALVTTGIVEDSWEPVFQMFALPPPSPPAGASRRLSVLVLVPLALATTWLLCGAQRRSAAALLVRGPRIEQVLVSRARAIDAQTAELRRIERDLHDGAQARIVALTMQLGMIGRALRPLGDAAAPARTGLDAAMATAGAALADLRHLVRGIHPPILTDRGLVAALSALAADCAVPVDVDLAVADRLRPPGAFGAAHPGNADAPVLKPAIEAAAYFTVAEALANATKHAGASRCVVTIGAVDGRLQVSVADDGHGGADPDGPGLTGVRHRVEALDGRVRVSSPAGGPTRIEVELPCG